jgi:hypothetical protein
MKTRLDACELSFSLAAHPTRDTHSERQTEPVSGSSARDVEPLAVGVSVIRPIAKGVARQTWVHDHDVVEWRYVN